MVYKDVYTVRYWLGPLVLEAKEDPTYLYLKEILKLYSDQLPMNMIEDDGQYLWLYCVFPISERMKRAICNWTGEMFPLTFEDDLKDYL